jgi:hypothetical protein
VQNSIEIAVTVPRVVRDEYAKTLFAEAIYNAVANIPEHPQIKVCTSGKGREFMSIYKVWPADKNPEPALGIARRWATVLKPFSGTEIKILVRDFRDDVYINTDESEEYFFGRVLIRYCIPHIVSRETVITLGSEADAIEVMDRVLRKDGFLGANSLDEANRLAKEHGGWVHYHFFGYRI